MDKGYDQRELDHQSTCQQPQPRHWTIHWHELEPTAVAFLSLFCFSFFLFPHFSPKMFISIRCCRKCITTTFICSTTKLEFGYSVMRHYSIIPLCTFCGKLQTFPTVNSKTRFLLHWTQKYTPVLSWRIADELLPEKELPTGHYAAYCRAASTCYPTWCM